MNKVINEPRKWTEWPSAPSSHLGQHESMFELLFERSGDAIWLLEPESATFLDCNQAAVDINACRQQI